MITLAELYRKLKTFFFDKSTSNTIAGHILVSTGSTYDLGSVDRPFRNVYADNLIGTPTSVTGTVLIDVDDPTDDYLAAKLTVSAPLNRSITGVSSKLMTLSMNAGDGLQIASSAVAVDSTVVRISRTLTAGSGLTGGGDLSLNRTFSVGAGTGITVGADSVSVNQAYSFNWSGTHTFNATPQINANINFINGARSITAESGLTVSPTGDLTLDPGGLIIIPNAQEAKTSTFIDLPTGIGGFRLWDRGSNYRQLTIGAIKVDELYARVFVADEVRIDRGEEYWSKSYGIVETDFTIPAVGSTVDVWFEDSRGLVGANLFSTNDWLLFRTIDMDAGLVIQKIWFQVGALLARDETSGAERQRWRLTRKHGGLIGSVVKKGSTALDVGQSGQGWIHLSALEQDGGPFIQIGDWDSAGGTKYPYESDAWFIRSRFGNLNGTIDYAVDTYGFAAGNNLGFTPGTGFSGFTVDEINGLRLFNTNLYLYDSNVLEASIVSDYGLRLLFDTNPFVHKQRSILWLDDITTPESATVSAGLNASANSTDRWLNLKIASSNLDTHRASIAIDATSYGGPTNAAGISIKSGGWDGKDGGVIDIYGKYVRFPGYNLVTRVLIGGETSHYAVSPLHIREDSLETGEAAGLTIEQASAGDAVTHYKLSLSQAFTIGIDNSDGNKFKISGGNALGPTDYIVIDPTTGSVTINGFNSGTSNPSDLTAGDGIILAGSVISVNSTVVRTSRTVSAGDGLTGGGDLSANRSFSVDGSVVRTTRNIIAGSGLTGGGSLTGDVTLNIGAGSGITVNADNISVNLAAASGLSLTGGLNIADSIAGSGLSIASKVLSVNVGDGLDIITDAVAVDVTDFIDTLYGLTENANNIRINLAATSGLEFSAGALQIADSIAGNGLSIASKVLSVNAGIGLDIVTDAVVVDVTDFIDTLYGLTEDANVIRVNLAAVSGLEFSAGALQIADAIAGNGLSISGKVLSVGEGLGIDVAANSISVDVTDIIDINYGLTENANQIRLSLNSLGGLGFTAGALGIKLDTNPGLSISGTGISILLSTPSGLEIVAGALQLSDTIAGNGIGISGKILSITAGDGITVQTDGVAVNQGFAFAWTGNQTWAGTAIFNNNVTFNTGVVTFNTNPKINANLDFIGGARSITGNGNITLSPAGDLILSPAGLNVLPLGSMQVDLGDYNRKWRTLYVAEMYSDILVQQNIMSTIGGRVLITPTTTLIADVAPSDLSIDVKHNNLIAGTFIILENSPAGVPQFEAMKITSSATPISGGYRYNVNRNWEGDPGGAESWSAGDGVASIGASIGDGYIDLASSATIYNDIGPTITIYARTSMANWNDIVPVTTMGNLESFVDYGAKEFGFAAGNNLSLDASSGFSGFTIDRLSGMRLFNTRIELYDGATKQVLLEPNKGLRFLIGDQYVSPLRSITWLLDINDSSFTSFGSPPYGVSMASMYENNEVFFQLAARTNGAYRSAIRLRAEEGATSAVFLLLDTDTGLTLDNAGFHLNIDTAGYEPSISLRQDGLGQSLIDFWITGGEHWGIGIDQSDAQSFVIANDMSLATVSSRVLRITTTGETLFYGPYAGAYTAAVTIDKRSATNALKAMGPIIAVNSSDITMFSANDLGQVTAYAEFIAPVVKATGSSGLSLEDNGGNVGVFIKDGGNVGIGMSAPLYKLHLKTADPVVVIQDTEMTGANAVAWLYMGESSSGGGLQGRLQLGYSAKNAVLQLVKESDGSTVECFTFTEGGLAGLGTASPNAPIHVYNATSQIYGGIFEGTRTASTLLYELINNAAASTSAGVNLALRAKSSTQTRSIFGIDATFNNTTDASRNSLVQLQTADNGTFATIATINGNDVGVGVNPATRFHVEGETRIQGATNADGILSIYANQGTTNPDRWKIQAETGDTLAIYSFANGTWRRAFAISDSGGFRLVEAIGVYEQTTSSAANVTINVGGSLVRSTSAARYKTNIRNLPDTLGLKLVRALHPVIFRSLCLLDPADTDFVGFIAEEVDALGAKSLVFYDEQGRPDGVQYDRITTILVSAVQELDRQVKALQAKVTALGG